MKTREFSITETTRDCHEKEGRYNIHYQGGRGRGGCHKNAYKYNPYFSIKGCNQLALFMQKILYQVCLVNAMWSY